MMLSTESVWDYPRPPRLEPVPQSIRVVCEGLIIAESTSCFRVLETSHPPVYYIPPAHIRMDLLTRSPRRASFCEWKGSATYWSMGAKADIAWSYEAPAPPFREITGYLAFYAGRMDACFVGDEKVTPQPGDFYGGWITSNLTGPFKGGPDTRGW